MNQFHKLTKLELKKAFFYHCKLDTCVNLKTLILVDCHASFNFLMNLSQLVSANLSTLSITAYKVYNDQNVLKILQKYTALQNISLINMTEITSQGSQYVGMLDITESSNHNVISEIKETCNDVLDYDLFKLCTDGPIETLTRTKYCQPAMAVSSLLAFERLKERYEGKLNVSGM